MIRLASAAAAILAAALAAEPLPRQQIPATAIASAAAQICRHGYARSLRPDYAASHALKLDAIRRAGLPENAAGRFEADHVTPICLGGSPTDVRNLQLQPWSEARDKDAVERLACRAVCASRNDALLLKLQTAFARGNWRSIPALIAQNAR